MKYTCLIGWLLCLGCSDSDGVGALQSGLMELVLPDAWTIVDADDDPMSSHRPSDLDCDVAGVYVEAGVLEIDTGRCPYVTLKQGTQYPLVEGDVIVVTIYHDDLFSNPPAEGHLALLLDGELSWGVTVPIPTAAALFSQRFTVSRALPAGARADFHLRNHGLNHWRLVSVAQEAAPLE